MRFLAPILRLLIVIVLVLNYLDDLTTDSLPITGLLFIGFFQFSFIIYSITQAFKEFKNGIAVKADFLRVYAILFELFNIIITAFIGYTILTNPSITELIFIEISKSIFFICAFGYLLYLDIKILRGYKGGQ